MSAYDTVCMKCGRKFQDAVLVTPIWRFDAENEDKLGGKTCLGWVHSDDSKCILRKKL